MRHSALPCRCRRRRSLYFDLPHRNPTAIRFAGEEMRTEILAAGIIDAVARDRTLNSKRETVINVDLNMSLEVMSKIQVSTQFF